MLWLIAPAFALPHHAIDVTLHPEVGELVVVDQYTPDDTGPIDFLLHAGLNPTVHTKGWTLETLGEQQGAVPLERFRLTPKKRKPVLPIELHYRGQIAHALDIQGEEHQRRAQETPGLISDAGAYLAGSSFWIPTREGRFTFELVPHLPDGWMSVSQGAPTPTGWTCDDPMEEVYLVAAAFTHSARTTAPGTRELGIDVYLREPDPELAARYQTATERYLVLYESMLPPYPFDRFALVENFWETGYGMPGFTLLGPRVIRFPWVLTSSYPHELLHNWWGNSVYIDPAGGNWAEGLTAYMADHLFAENRGKAATYRRDTLKKYTDIAADHDFPLVEFQGRTSPTTESVGYGKSLMLWHQLRLRMGDEAFLKGLSAFYEAEQFQAVGFMDLEPYLSKAGGIDLKPVMEAWTSRAGAISLSVDSLKVDGKRLQFTLKQDQAEPFPAWVPVHITLESGLTIRHEAAMEGPEHRIELEFESAPVRLDVDPTFDLMRTLDPLETPPVITTMWAEESPTFVLPTQASATDLEAWREFAKGLSGRTAPTFVDDDISELPDGAWVLGRDNRFGPVIAERLSHAGIEKTPSGMTVDGAPFDPADSLVLVSRGSDAGRANAWVAAPPEARPGLARKVPHYGKYSLLVFTGSEPKNVVKTSWPARNSPLTFNLTDGPLAPASFEARSPLGKIDL